MMTEDEAKTKWCPFVRASYYSGPTPASPAEQGFLGNRDVNFGHLPNTECIGSACMAFRMVAPQYETTETGLGQIPKGDGWRQLSRRDEDWGLRWQRITQAGGCYCGLAGRPE